MYISKIEIDNFKSFANKTEIPFLEGFTTVSGPNGSGKSNIIDSILFALGLSTSRTLRAEKIFHLINTHNKRNDASVKVYFARKDGADPFSVTRKIKKSSNGFISSYYINDKTSTLTDIHDELSRYNISPGCYRSCSIGSTRQLVFESSVLACRTPLFWTNKKRPEGRFFIYCKSRMLLTSRSRSVRP